MLKKQRNKFNKEDYRQYIYNQISWVEDAWGTLNIIDKNIPTEIEYETDKLFWTIVWMKDWEDYNVFNIYTLKNGN